MFKYDTQLEVADFVSTPLNSSNVSLYFNPNCNEPSLSPLVKTLTGTLTKLPSCTVNLGTLTSIVVVGKSYSTLLSITL